MSGKGVKINESKNENAQSRERMKLISVHLPEWMIRELEKLVQKGYFPSRSEAIRVAIHLLIMRYQDIGSKTQQIQLLPGR